MTAVVAVIGALGLMIVADRVQTATNRRQRERAARRLAAAGIPPDHTPATARGRARRAVRYSAPQPLPLAGPRWWQRLRSMVGLGVVTAVLGLAVAVTVLVVLGAALFLLNQAVG